MQRRPILTAFAAIAFLCAASSPALARTIAATAGMPSMGTSAALFSAPNGFVFSSSSLQEVWIIPIAFDASGSRTITVRGRANSNGSLNCQAIALNTNGTQASASASVSFPANNTFTSISLFLSSVPASAVGNVFCRLSASGSSFLLGVDYAP